MHAQRMEEMIRLEARLDEILAVREMVEIEEAERERREAEEDAAEDRAYQFARLTLAQIEPQNEAEQRNAEIRRRERPTVRREEQQEASELARENRERFERNPLLPTEWAAPRQWRNIARLRSRNTRNVYAEEMISVDARSWHLETGEHIQIVVDFADSIPPDLTLRLTALAMELSARQIDDDTLARLLNGII